MRQAPPRTSSGGTIPPDLTDLVTTDEGPMRRELLRQIERLEHELAGFSATIGSWQVEPASPSRGPAVQETRSLEEIRDELVEAVRALHAKALDMTVTQDEPLTFDGPKQPDEKRKRRRRRNKLGE